MHFIKSLFPQKVKNIYHLGQAILANFVYGFPSKRIKIVGVTGTNGKTTTVQMISKILEESGKKVAVMSTINFKLGGKEWINKTKYTTTSSFKVQKFIKEAVTEGCEYIVLETSSHSLDQYRVWGIRYYMAVITNVTREHLDYHKTMETYRKAKQKLFKMTGESKGVLVVNLDMEKPEEYLGFSAGKKIGYSLEKSARMSEGRIIAADDIDLQLDKSFFNIDNVKFELNLIGRFNIENSLAAISAGIAEGVLLNVCSKALSKIKGIPGRMERIKNDKGIDIIIDYAVTPDSLEKLYSLLAKNKKMESSKIIAVFGSCGERDRGKRPIMGDVVSKYADRIIITNEDPYFEDPQVIMDEVSAGVKNKVEGENFWKISDRREAIKKALNLANFGDIIVVTGKGAEESMAIREKHIPWSDRRVILEELKKLF